MFEQLKRKRMMIESSVTGKRNEREGMTSAQRRKLVEKDLSQYNQLLNKTMQNFRKVRQGEKSPQKGNQTLNDQAFREIKERIEEDKPIAATPSVKDIAPLIQPSSALANQFYELSPQPKNQSIDFSPNKNISNFYKKQPIPITQKPQLNIHNMEQFQSHRESQPQIEDQQIKFPKMINNSSKTQSNNNSDAIFFTSHFKEIMNNQINSPLKTSPPPLPQEDPKISPLKPPVEPVKIQSLQYHDAEEGTARFDHGLKDNASHQSLAISNDSSLKYSLNESAIQDIITRKLSNELVMESVNPYKGIIAMAISLQVKQNIKEFIQFSKTLKLSRFIQQRIFKAVFEELMVNKQMRSQARQSQIKVASYLQQRGESIINHCFNQWNRLTKYKNERIQKMIRQKQRQAKEKAFRALKVRLCDRRINHQIDMYYVSKIFRAFKNATDKQSKRQNQKAYRLYFKNLKKRMFQSFIQGCYKSRRETDTLQASQNHYYYTIIKKYFEGWKAFLPKQQKYIRLSMTTKNVLKQTTDHRLLQTKTFDFYEIK